MENKRIRPKLRSNGTVIIHPVKEKMYTREEVMKIVTRAFHAIHKGEITFNGCTVDLTTSPGEWFDQNYPE